MGLPGHTLRPAQLTYTGEVEYRIGQGQLLMAGVVGYLNLQRHMLSVTYMSYREAHGTWWAGAGPSAISDTVPAPL